MSYSIGKYFLSAFLTPDITIDSCHPEMKGKPLPTKSFNQVGKTSKQANIFNVGPHVRWQACAQESREPPRQRHWFNFRLRGAEAWARAGKTSGGGGGPMKLEGEKVSQAEGLGGAEVQGCEVGCYGWRSEWSTWGSAEAGEPKEVGRSQITDLSLSLKDFKQGMDVSRFAIKYAASGSRRSGVSQTGGRKSSQKMAVGEHMRCSEDFCLTENAS